MKRAWSAVGSRQLMAPASGTTQAWHDGGVPTLAAPCGRGGRSDLGVPALGPRAPPPGDATREAGPPVRPVNTGDAPQQSTNAPNGAITKAPHDAFV
jgi:hypothetical protein